MMRTEHRSGGSNAESFGWFALGAVVGVTAAVLFAPDKGSHTRRRLASQEVLSKSRELFEKGREIAQEAADMFERGRRMAEAGFDEQLEPELTFERGL